MESDFISDDEGSRLVGSGWVAEATPYLIIMVDKDTYSDEGNPTGSLEDGIRKLCQGTQVAESIVGGLLNSSPEGEMAFDSEKMKKLVDADPFLMRKLDELVAGGCAEQSALETLFNSYVLDDEDMEHTYNRIQRFSQNLH